MRKNREKNQTQKKNKKLCGVLDWREQVFNCTAKPKLILWVKIIFCEPILLCAEKKLI